MTVPSALTWPPLVSSPGIRFIVPTNSATNAVAGRVYSSAGDGDLLQRAVLHHPDPVRHRQRLFLVVGDEQGGDAQPLLQRADLLPQRS